MSRRLIALASLSLVLPSSFSQAAPRPVTHVACVGDSITAGAGASQSSANYPSRLQRLFGDSVQVQNFGRSGATLLTVGDLPYIEQPEYTAATNFVDNAGSDAVVSVVIVLGANDSKPFNWDGAGRPEQFLTDYLALVEHFQGLSTQPTVYVALPLATGNNPCCDIRGDVIADDQIPLIEQVAQERRVPIIDLNAPTAGHPEYFGDGVHPNDGGYTIMADLVKAGLGREPSASIEMPVMGASFPAGSIPITVAVSGDTVDIASVEFFDGDTSLGTETTPPFTFTWQATVGTHNLTIKAVDTTLADVTSDPRGITVTEVEMDGAGGAGGTDGSGGDNGAGGANLSAGGAASGAPANGGAANAGDEARGGTGGREDVMGAAGAQSTATPSPVVEQPGANGPVDVPGTEPSVPAPVVSDVGATPANGPITASTASSPTAAGVGNNVPPSAMTTGGSSEGCASVPLTRSPGGWQALGLLLVALGQLRRHRAARTRTTGF